MKKGSNTKKAFTFSILLVFISIIFLVGTTYAWFTDSATSARNKIIVGNLDVELLYADPATIDVTTNTIPEAAWKPVKSDTNLFKSSDDTLWEPGHTEMTFLRIKNNGSLTVKYDFKINVYGDEEGGEEKTYLNVSDSPVKLSQYLVMNKTEGVDIKARESYWINNAEEETAAMGKLSRTDTNIVLAPGETKEITLVVYIPKSVKNEANPKENTPNPELYFGIELNATQADKEEDSFGSNYDANITEPTSSPATE